MPFKLLRVEKHFKPFPGKRILLHLWVSFQNFLRASPSFVHWCPPPLPPRSYLVCDRDLVNISQKIFAEFDKDGSGTMDMFEMRKALRKQGIVVLE